MLRNTLKTNEYFFPFGYDYIHFFSIFDTFLKRQINLKSMFYNSALSVKLC
jgi:hypothetical protein